MIDIFRLCAETPKHSNIRHAIAAVDYLLDRLSLNSGADAAHS